MIIYYNYDFVYKITCFITRYPQYNIMQILLNLTNNYQYLLTKQYNRCIIKLTEIIMETFEITSDFIRGHIDTIILKSILSGDKHAQEISNYIEEKSNGSYVVKQATLYSALKRLENTKLVNAYWRDAPEGGRRRYFKITQKGAFYQVF